jgi:dihydrofolate synthase/folylpolyglutamate synthase
MVDIAAEKAGIAKAGVPLVTQLYPPTIGGRIGQVAHEAGAKWLPRGGAWDASVSRSKLKYRDRAGTLDLPLPRLPCRHQAMNAALCVAMLRHQDQLEVPVGAFEAAMEWAYWPARMQRLLPGPLTQILPEGSELWIDGGHNPAAARAIAAYARRHFASGLPLVLVFASLTSKDPRGTLRPFHGIATAVHTVPIGDHDFRDPADLAALARSMGFRASAHATLGEALGAVETPARVLVFGSLYLAGEALAANGQAPD